MVDNIEDIDMEKERREIDELNGKAKEHITNGKELNGKAKAVVEKSKKLFSL